MASPPHPLPQPLLPCSPELLTPHAAHRTLLVPDLGGQSKQTRPTRDPESDINPKGPDGFSFRSIILESFADFAVQFGPLDDSVNQHINPIPFFLFFALPPPTTRCWLIDISRIIHHLVFFLVPCFFLPPVARPLLLLLLLLLLTHLRLTHLRPPLASARLHDEVVVAGSPRHTSR